MKKWRHRGHVSAGFSTGFFSSNSLLDIHFIATMDVDEDEGDIEARFDERDVLKQQFLAYAHNVCRQASTTSEKVQNLHRFVKVPFAFAVFPRRLIPVFAAWP